MAAGGGREIYSLEPMGYKIYSFECNEELIKYANAFLSRERLISRVAFSEPDHCPLIGKKLDGAILSWGTYSHIKSSSKRISLLKEIKENLKPKAPLLISFWVYSGENLNSKIVARVANLFKPYEAIEIGDALPTQFTHSFDKEQIERELIASGYELVYYSTEAYGHAVGLVKA